MSEFNYLLSVQSDTARRTTTGWLLLGLVSLLAAGVFSLLLVLARTPVVQDFTPFIDFFRTALVIHVTLSVLIWLLSMSAAGWSLSTSTDKPWWDRLSFVLAASGTAIVIVCPFVGAGDHQGPADRRRGCPQLAGSHTPVEPVKIAGFVQEPTGSFVDEH